MSGGGEASLTDKIGSTQFSDESNTGTYVNTYAYKSQLSGRRSKKVP